MKLSIGITIIISIFLIGNTSVYAYMDDFEELGYMSPTPYRVVDGAGLTDEYPASYLWVEIPQDAHLSSFIIGRDGAAVEECCDLPAGYLSLEVYSVSNTSSTDPITTYVTGGQAVAAEGLPHPSGINNPYIADLDFEVPANTTLVFEINPTPNYYAVEFMYGSREGGEFKFQVDNITYYDPQFVIYYSDPAGDGIGSFIDNVSDLNETNGNNDTIIGNETDGDNDTIPDSIDNCPLTPNANQIDTDDDGTGDACDSDDDGDTVPDGTDNCPLTANIDQNDTDGDGTGDACEAPVPPTCGNNHGNIWTLDINGSRQAVFDIGRGVFLGGKNFAPDTEYGYEILDQDNGSYVKTSGAVMTDPRGLILVEQIWTVPVDDYRGHTYRVDLAYCNKKNKTFTKKAGFVTDG